MVKILISTVWPFVMWSVALNISFKSWC
jgi:hypothetical protein